MIVLATDPGRSGGFALVDGSWFTPGVFRGKLPSAPVLAETSRFEIAQLWKADVVVCERQYVGGLCRGSGLLTLSRNAGISAGILLKTSGATALYGFTPHQWKELLCPNGGTLRKDIFSARVARELGATGPLAENFDILDAIGLAWAFLACPNKDEFLEYTEKDGICTRNLQKQSGSGKKSKIRSRPLRRR